MRGHAGSSGLKISGDANPGEINIGDINTLMIFKERNSLRYPVKNGVNKWEERAKLWNNPAFYILSEEDELVKETKKKEAVRLYGLSSR